MMATRKVYYLKSRSPFHIGERGIGLEATQTHVPADTLFSALCSMWRELYGAEDLVQAFLGGFANGETPPVLLSSAFPFAGEVRFFPRPLGHFAHVQLEPEDQKAYKRVRFVSSQVFAAIIRGDTCSFSTKDCINAEAAWITTMERQSLQEWTDDESEDIVLWKKAVVPRVTLDRMTSASEIWHFGEVVLADDASFWFCACFDEKFGADQQRKFEAALQLLGDHGLGGERGSGRGLFSVAELQEEAWSEVPDARAIITLSPCCPRDATEASLLTGSDAAYELVCRRGWISSPEGSHLRRKSVWMFAEGSVLTTPPTRQAGRLVDVTPAALQDHRVYRYGYAFPVGIKI